MSRFRGMGIEDLRLEAESLEAENDALVRRIEDLKSDLALARWDTEGSRQEVRYLREDICGGRLYDGLVALERLNSRALRGLADDVVRATQVRSWR